MTRVIFHVGPPKSGTSAIQKWLSSNHDLLLDYGIYYPTHDCDTNGVSSGNLQSVYDVNRDGDIELSSLKVAQLKSHCQTLHCKTLLLSSEYFFQHISELANHFPTAEFLAYLRFPLEVAESSYNQGIKRHGEVRALGLPQEPRTYQLEVLDGLINKLGGQRFLLRPYHKQCFVDENLLSDFVSAVEPSLLEDENLTLPREFVNTSYSLEALELKRWLNQFTLGALQQPIDHFLQRYKQGTMEYSVIPPAQFQKYKSSFVEKLSAFCLKYNVHNSEVFINECMETKQKPYIKQQIDNDRFIDVFIEMLNANPELEIAMQDMFSKKNSFEGIRRYPERIALIQDAFSISMRVNYFQHRVKRRLFGTTV